MMRSIGSGPRHSVGKTLAARKTLGLFSSCAIGALMLAAPQNVQAQAFQGTPTPQIGTPLITPGVNTHNIQLDNIETVINWSIFDVGGTGVVDFLPVGNTVNFSNTTSITDYTVLNRILPTDSGGTPTARSIALNGFINSTIDGSQGGNVWFYSPTGIIVGPDATFSVGGLVLTTNDINFGTITGGTDLYGPSGEIQFRGAVDSAGLIQIQPSSSISVPQISASNYIALVAPRVEQAGNIEADGAIGLIAAEQLDLTVNGGLFDIAITTGTTDANGVVHTGRTGGPTSSGAGDQQRISIVALPKNTALTMMLSGDISYDSAGGGVNDGSAVVLSSGFTTDVPAGVAGNDFGNIAITNAFLTNEVEAYASGGIEVTAGAGEAVGFDGLVTLNALGDILVSAIGLNAQIVADSDLNINAGQPGTGGNVSIIARDGGDISIIDTLRVDVSSDSHAFAPHTVGDGLGGTIDLVAVEGTISASDIELNAIGIGAFDPVQPYNGTGGTIRIASAGGGSITTNYLGAEANGVGGNSDFVAGSGFGGLVSLLESEAFGGTFAVGSVDLYATGSGGEGLDQSGNAVGGRIITLLSSPQTFGGFSAIASAYAAHGSGSGISGTATALSDAISISIGGPDAVTVNGQFVLEADAIAEVETNPGDVNQAGGIVLDVFGGGSLNVDGLIVASADARYNSDALFSTPDIAPVMRGGSVVINVDGGNVTAPFALISARASTVGAAVAAGNAFGGITSLNILDGGSVAINNGTDDAELLMFASVSASGDVVAPNAFGGTAEIILTGGTLDVLGDLQVDAGAYGNSYYGFSGAGPGHNAFGGNASIELLAGVNGAASLDVSGHLDVVADGDATTGDGNGDILGDGGIGQGGTAIIAVDAGNLSAGDIFVTAQGFGGNSGEAPLAGAAFQSGFAQGGSASFETSGGIIDATSLSLDASASGGERLETVTVTGLYSHGGTGVAGDVDVNLFGGTVTLTSLAAEATGRGGDGGITLPAGIAGNGADGVGGGVNVAIANGAVLTTDFTALQAAGAGGFSDPSGGDGFGGGVNLIELGAVGGTLDLGDLLLRAGASGGPSADLGGDALGGLVNIDLQTTQTWSSLTADVTAVAGPASSGGAGLGIGGTANGQSDAVSLTLLGRGDLNVAGDVVLRANADAAYDPNVGDVSQAGGINVLIGAGNTLDVNSGVLSLFADSLYGLGSGSGLPEITGDMIGGDILVDVDGGSLIAASILASAGSVGFGGNVTGGSVSGGSVELSIANGGSVLVDNDVGTAQLELLATGEGAEGIDSADSFGGTSLLTISDGTLTILGDLTVEAAGISQFIDLGFPVEGPDATGGDATLQLLAGTLGTALLDVTGIVTVSADADASTPDGFVGNFLGDGGLATGGDALVDIAAGTLNASEIEVVARGRGGNSAIAPVGDPAFNSGDGQGGTAEFSSSGGRTNAGSLLVSAEGEGGERDFLFITGGDGAHGGDGIGGTASANLSGGVIGLDTLEVNASGEGGNGEESNLGSVSGDAGDGIGGVAQLGMAAGSTAFLTVGTAVDVLAEGVGAAPGNTGTGVDGLGGDATGGAATVNFADGQFQFNDLTISGSAFGEIGSGINSVAGMATFVLTDTLGGGGLTRDVSGLMQLLASATNQLGAATQAGTTALSVNPGSATSALTLEGLTVEATGETAPAGDGFALDISGAPLVVNTFVGIDVARDVDLVIADPHSFDVGTDLFISGRQVDETGIVHVDGDARINATQGINFADLRVAGATDLFGDQGAVIVSALSSIGQVNALGQSVTLTSDGALDVFANATLTDITVTTEQDLILQGNAVGDVTLRSRLGSVDANGITAENLSVRAAQNITARRIDVADIASFDADGLFSANSAVVARIVSVRSGDVDLGVFALIGERGTTERISFIDITDYNPLTTTLATHFGGADVAGEYSLDQFELGRLFADDAITLVKVFTPPSPGEPGTGPSTPVFIGDINLSFGPSGNIGTGGELAIISDPDVIVHGNVNLITVSNADTFSIDPPSIEIVADTGSIHLATASGGIIGTIELVGGVLAIASQSVLDSIRGETDVAVISAALDAPLILSNGDVLSSRIINIDVTDGVYIQNMGGTDDFADRRGFLTESFNINTDSTATKVVINGQTFSDNGPATGLNTLAQITINGVTPIAGGLFDPLSSVNGCVIGANCTGVTPPPVTPPPVVTPPVVFDPPVPQDPELEPPSDDQLPEVEGVTGSSLVGTPIVSIAETPPLITPPLVDEPVTGIGNDDLWDGLCPPGGESCAGDGDAQ